MKETTIEYLAYIIKEAKKNNQPQPIFFLGAGASRTGGIPLTNDIVKDIENKFSDNPRIKELAKGKSNYYELMKALEPYQRESLLKNYLVNAQINVAHIYLAQLLKNKYVDHVLTISFDNLILRALALFNEFPSTYDIAILKELTTTILKKQSILYLNGQDQGLFLFSVKKEVEKIKTTILRIFNSIRNKRPWIFLGYSGDDPIFEYVKSLGRFDYGLYWVKYKDDSLSEEVESFLKNPNTNASVIKGYDADSFMLKLNSELNLEQPDIIDKPFSSIKKMLNNIVDIDDDEHFKGVRKRLEISKKQVDDAIEQFEEVGVEPTNIESFKEIHKNTEIDLLKREIINILIKRDYNVEDIKKIEQSSKKLKDKELDSLLSELYFGLGTNLGYLLETKEGKEAEEVYNQAFKNYQKLTEIKSDDYRSFYNWGIDLGNLARKKSGKESEILYYKAFKKFEKTIEIKPNDYDAFDRWGTYLGTLAKEKTGEEANKLYHEAFNKFKSAIDIKLDDYSAFDNWGTILVFLAKTKTGKEATDLYVEAFKKYQKAYDISGKAYNISCIFALISEKKNALIYLNKSLENKEVTIGFIKKDEDWKDYLKDEDFINTLSKYDRRSRT